MPVIDPRVDAYIEKSAPFAQPILVYLRKLVHEVCPDVEETIKWNFPNFVYKGSILCSMSSFKQHCAFIFFKASLMKDPEGIFTAIGKSAMGQLGQIRELKDLPKDKIMKDYLREAMKLNEAGVKVKPRQKAAVKPEVPEYFRKALEQNKTAAGVFEAFPPGKRKDYIEWLEEAKTEATREKRLATAIEWISEGKGRNWRYQK